MTAWLSGHAASCTRDEFRVDSRVANVPAARERHRSRQPWDAASSIASYSALAKARRTSSASSLYPRSSHAGSPTARAAIIAPPSRPAPSAPMAADPLSDAGAPDFTDPLGMLVACHRRLERQLATLDRLQRHLP